MSERFVCDRCECEVSKGCNEFRFKSGNDDVKILNFCDTCYDSFKLWMQRYNSLVGKLLNSYRRRR